MTVDSLQADREAAVGIAREAGRILMEGWGTRPAIDFKSEDINLVTEYDKRSEALIVERLAAAFPDISEVNESLNPAAQLVFQGEIVTLRGPFRFAGCHS